MQIWAKVLTPDYAGPEFCIVLFDHNNAMTFWKDGLTMNLSAPFVDHGNNDTGVAYSRVHAHFGCGRPAVIVGVFRIRHLQAMLVLD